MRIGTAKLPFNVAPDKSRVVQPGTYTAWCSTFSHYTPVGTNFEVTGETEATTTTMTEATTTTSETAAPAKWYIRVYNIDDHGTAYVNGTPVAKADFGGDSGWIDVTSLFSGPTTSVRFIMLNDLQGYAWGFAIKRNGTIIWQDVQGEVNVQGANNNDQSRPNQVVYDHTFSVSQSGQVTQAP